jgi:hypothetical protein
VASPATAERRRPTAVGSGDLLGIKVIKLNKIKETQTIGVQICSLLETGASFLFNARNFRLPTQTKNAQTCRHLATSFRTAKNLRSNPPPKHRRLLDA